MNRLLGLALFGGLAVLSGWVAIETGARIAGREGHLLPVDYRGWWGDLQDWNPGDASQTAVFVGVALLGLTLLVMELWPPRRQRTLEIASTHRGHVLLRTRTVAPYLRGRLIERPWIHAANPRLRLRERRADLRVTPRTVRPWSPDELAEASTGLRSDLERLGLEPGRVEITPRTPAGHGSTGLR